MRQISLQRIYKFQNSRGITLIEILVAIAVFVSSLIFILPQINRSENKVKKNLRNLQALNRTLYSYSRIYNRSYRLVLETKEDESSYWVEIKKNLDEKQQEEDLLEQENLLEQEENIAQDETEEDPNDIPHPFFEPDFALLEKPVTLPAEMQFVWPKSVNKDQEIVYITYNPHSISPPVTVFLKKQNFTWTLLFNSITGELEISEDEST